MKVGWIESPRKDAFFFAKTTGLLVRGMYLEQDMFWKDGANQMSRG